MTRPSPPPYGGNLCRHCINCIHAVSEPEIGYACDLGRETHLCEDYKVDADYVRRQAEAFIEGCERWGYGV